MEAAASRSGSLPISSSQPLRKEWRAVPQDPEHVKLGHSDERTIYEEGAGPLDADDFCSITIHGEGAGDDMLQERLQEIARRQEELHQMEVGLRARSMARSGILEVQNEYEARTKEQADAASKIKEQLQERDKHIHELEMKLEDRDRELRAVKIDSEAAWAKEDLLREQNKELTTFRRERDNSEAERAQHLQKIHEFQEHIQEKESQFLALEEQHRVAQETILFKDEQLREAHAWIARAQEMDALHSTTNQSLQAEIRERTEQFNQYWIGLQRQFAEVERHHLQVIQQLQLELAEAREHNGIYKDDSQVARENPIDGSSYVQNKGSPINVNGSAASNGNLAFISNGNLDSVSSSNASMETEHCSAVPVVPSSTLGMGAFLPPGQMNALHPFVMHPQGVPPSVPPTNPPNPQSRKGHLQPVSATPVQHWSNEQVVADISQVLESNGNQYLVSQEPQEIVAANLQLPASLGYDPPKLKSTFQVQDENLVVSINQAREQVLPLGQQGVASSVVSSTAESHPVSSNNVAECNDNTVSGSSIPGKTMEPTLLDERSLLACIVRAIPAGSDGRIRISSTLPNRLGKMLAPLHWHDYKKYYGKLDDFVAHHPELFVIEGDFIHLREGAQEIISATTAYAKVAAAAASSAPYSSLLPSVAVTPVARVSRHKKAPSTDSHAGHSHISKVHNQPPNGVDFNVVQGLVDLSVSNKTKDLQELNGLSEMRPNHSSVHKTFGNGANLDRAALAPSQNKLSNGRLGFGGRQQGRSSGAGLISRRQN